MLESETIHSLDFTLPSVDVPDILSCIPFMETHSLNSSDAAILASFLRYAATLDDACVLVAADERLLRAAAAEGLKTLNPELIPAGDVSAFLDAL